MSRRDTLTAAIRAVDLPQMVAERYPESNAQPGKAGTIYASWRGNTNTPAVSLSRKQGTWLWHDLADGQGGNAFDFLVEIVGMERQEAAHLLLERAGLADAPPEQGTPALKPLPAEVIERYRSLPGGVPVESLRGRGFNKAMLETYDIRADGGDALIPITSPEGVVMNVKRRLANPGKGGKYRYEHKGHAAPPWCSPDSRHLPVLFIVEGELNAIVAHAALQEAGEVTIGVMGVAGAKADLYPGLCLGKSVYVYADGDEPGEQARAAWADKARADGARSVHVCPPNFQDFCDHAGATGRGGLAMLIAGLFAAAEQRYGALDRLLGNGSVRDHLRAAEEYVSGGVVHATGFKELDRKTGGVRESGVFGIAGLSSMGKSAVLRRMGSEHVRNGGIFRLYSPDQSPRAVYRLLASQLSGVGSEEVRTGNYTAATLRLYETPEAAKKAWLEVHEHVIVELSQRFQVSEEGEAAVIFEDMERARDQGVTMLGIDYLQGIEPLDHRDRDGMVAKQLRKLSHKLRLPVLAALQLAKYKFPPNRESGLPVPSDIEGSGSYYQDAEMMFMVYNDEIYRNKYGSPEYVGTNDTPGIGRLLLTKDKEGADGVYYMRWEKRLATYHDVTLPWSLERERAGLM